MVKGYGVLMALVHGKILSHTVELDDLPYIYLNDGSSLGLDFLEHYNTSPKGYSFLNGN